jgi:hypothetical protein
VQPLLTAPLLPDLSVAAPVQRCPVNTGQVNLDFTSIADITIDIKIALESRIECASQGGRSAFFAAFSRLESVSKGRKWPRFRAADLRS